MLLIPDEIIFSSTNTNTGLSRVKVIERNRRLEGIGNTIEFLETIGSNISPDGLFT